MSSGNLLELAQKCIISHSDSVLSDSHVVRTYQEQLQDVIRLLEIARDNSMSTSKQFSLKSLISTSPKYDTAAIYRTLLRLRRRYNDVALVSRLPAEILEKIFLLCTYTKDDPFWSNRSSLTWIDASHVCQRWRDVALHYTTLWSYIIVPHPMWATTCLERSRGSTIALFASVGKGQATNMVVLHVLKDFSRIRDLSLEVGTCSDINPHLSRPTANLESFDLRCRACITSQRAHLLPHPIFSGHAPALRNLTLSCCSIVLDNNLVCNLTMLKLVRCDLRITMAQLVRVFQAMHILDVLHIENSVPKMGNHVFPAESCATLPLSKLVLDVPPYFCVILLDHIVFPSTATTSFGIQLRYPLSEDIHRTFRLIAEKCASDDAKTLAPFGDVALRVRSLESHFVIPVPDSAAKLWINFSMGSYMPSLINLAIDLMISVLGSPRVRVVSMEDRFCWTNGCLRLEGVETLCLNSEPVHRFLSASTQYIDFTTQGRPMLHDMARPFFPDLKTLILCAALSDPNVPYLLDWLAARQDASNQVLSLKLYEWTGIIDKSRVKGLVQELCMDGVII